MLNQRTNIHRFRLHELLYVEKLLIAFAGINRRLSAQSIETEPNRVQRLNNTVVQVARHSCPLYRCRARTQPAQQIDVVNRRRHLIHQVAEETQLFFRAPPHFRLKQKQSSRHVRRDRNSAQKQPPKWVLSDKFRGQIALCTRDSGATIVDHERAPGIAASPNCSRTGPRHGKEVPLLFRSLQLSLCEERLARFAYQPSPPKICTLGFRL